MTIRFDEQVALVTGAGNGLGKTYALALAAHGAKVVVNDLGASLDGTGGSSKPAAEVVAQIEQQGGEAIANGANVTKIDEVEKMVQVALEKWGRIDILINNAGILRDKTFLKAPLDDFMAVLNVHLMGSVNCSKAVWEVMHKQAYGRIVMITSTSGLYGNFGQANYSTAKMALVGLVQTLQVEGQKHNIHVNALAPGAATRMVENLVSEEVANRIQPEQVTPAVLFLASQHAPQRTIIASAGGLVSRVYIGETEGVQLQGDDLTPENIASLWEEISNLEKIQVYPSIIHRDKILSQRWQQPELY